MKPFVQTGGYGFNRAKINSNKQYNTAKEMFTQIVANIAVFGGEIDEKSVYRKLESSVGNCT